MQAKASRYDGLIHGFFGMGPIVPAANAAVDEAGATLRDALQRLSRLPPRHELGGDLSRNPGRNPAQSTNPAQMSGYSTTSLICICGRVLVKLGMSATVSAASGFFIPARSASADSK